MISGNVGIKIGDIQYPADIFTKWTESELNAINIYKVETDLSNFKSIEWYINTNLNHAMIVVLKKLKLLMAQNKNHTLIFYILIRKNRTKYLMVKMNDVKQEGLKN